MTVAERLLELAKERGVLKFGEFTLTSGQISRYYFDGRLLTLDPEGAHLISSALIPILKGNPSRSSWRFDYWGRSDSSGSVPCQLS